MTTMVKEKAMNWLDAVKKYDNMAITVSYGGDYGYVKVDGVCIINNEAYAILSSDYFTLNKIFMRRGIPHITSAIKLSENIKVSNRIIDDLFIKIDAQLLVEDCPRPPLKEAHRPKIFVDLLKVLKEDGSL